MKSKLVQWLLPSAALVLAAATAVLTANIETNVYDWSKRKNPIPDKYVFQTKYLGGTQIVFDHKQHTEELEIACIECHHVEGCAHCHKKELTTVDVQESKVALHTNCYSCHEGMTCTDCHKQ